MKCFKCNCSPQDKPGEPFYPIDPKGHGRRWSCESCMTNEEKNSVPQDVKDIAEVLRKGVKT